MKYAVKASLMSGLLFPGSGQLMLKHYIRGMAFIVTTTLALVFFVIKATQHAFVILDRIQSEGGMLDLTSLSEAAVDASRVSDDLTLNLLLLVIIVCWAASVADAFFLGNRKDQKDAPVPQ